MTLNYDCIRDILLFLEKNLEYTNDPISLEHKRLSINETIDKLSNTYEKTDIQYSIEKLYEAHYISMPNIKYNNLHYIVSGSIDDITWEGHDFLNNIREKTIWEATKSGAKKIGVTSISALSMISMEVVKAITLNPSVIQKIVDSIPFMRN